MSNPDTNTLDGLIRELGDCGLFQIVAVVIVHGACLPGTWSSIFMSYGNYNPGWRCDNWTRSQSDMEYDDENNSSIHQSYNVSHWRDSSCDVYEACDNIVYIGEISTIVTEWNLACDKNWITSLMISIHMGGYILGTFTAGILSNKIGRKSTQYSFLAFHAALNFIAAFSTSWLMFCVLGFFIGITTGVIGMTNFVYSMEFVSSKWRGIISVIPFSTTSGIIFVLVAMLIKDWRTLYVVNASITALLFLTVFWVPESIRWLAARGKTDKAVKIVRNIANINKKEVKSLDAIFSLAEQERSDNLTMKKYTLLDLYRNGFAQKTVILTYTAVCMLFCSTVIQFGIKILSGDFFLNLFLFNLIPTITALFLPFLVSLAGRKFSIVLLIGLAAFDSIVLVTIDFISIQFDKGLTIVVLTLLFKVLVDSYWPVLLLYIVELYPTPLRSLGYSHAFCIARLLGMAAPFFIPDDASMAYISHIVMASILAVNWCLLFLLPETVGKDLDGYTPLEEDS